MPGCKSAWNDAPWRQTLQGLGLWHAAVRPDAERRILRTRLRHWAAWLEPRALPILPRQQALKLLNMLLREVLADLTGVTGHALLRAIVHGERDPLKLAQLRTPTCQSSADALAKALTGAWRDA